MSNLTISWVRYTEDDEEETVLFPATNIVCYTCNGTGKTVNPDIDGNGITQSEMDELGEDFREDYMSGVYDVQCRTCKGERVIPEIDEEACERNPKLRELLKLKNKEDQEAASDDASERWLRMAESGERW
jgi:hypothetical protein